MVLNFWNQNQLVQPLELNQTNPRNVGSVRIDFSVLKVENNVPRVRFEFVRNLGLGLGQIILGSGIILFGSLSEAADAEWNESNVMYDM